MRNGKNTVFPARPKRLGDVPVFVFKHIHVAVRMDMFTMSLAGVRRDNLFYRTRQCRVAKRERTDAVALGTDKIDFEEEQSNVLFRLIAYINRSTHLFPMLSFCVHIYIAF